MKLGKRICDSCYVEIKDELCRFCIMRDVDDNPRVLHFHYFSPCWNFDMLCKKYSNHEFVKVGFDCDEKITNDPNYIQNLKSNLKLWIHE